MYLRLIGLVLGLGLTSCNYVGQANRPNRDTASRQDDAGSTAKEGIKFSLSLPEDVVIATSEDISEAPDMKEGMIEVACSEVPGEKRSSANFCLSESDASFGLCMPAPEPIFPYDDLHVTFVLDLVSLDKDGQTDTKGKDVMAHVEFPVTCSKNEITVSLASELADGTYELIGDLVYPKKGTKYHGTTGAFAILGGISVKPITLDMLPVESSDIPVEVVFSDANTFSFDDVASVTFTEFNIKSGGMCGGDKCTSFEVKTATSIAMQKNDSMVLVELTSENLTDGSKGIAAPIQIWNIADVNQSINLVIASYDKEKEMLACASYTGGSYFTIAMVNGETISVGSCYMEKAKNVVKAFYHNYSGEVGLSEGCKSDGETLSKCMATASEK